MTSGNPQSITPTHRRARTRAAGTDAGRLSSLGVVAIDRVAAFMIALLPLVGSAATPTAEATGDGVVSAGSSSPTGDAAAIRPFSIRIPQAALDDLRRRLAATRWPDRETAPDRSQGVPLDDLQ